MTLASDVQALIAQNPTAAVVLDVVELVLATYEAATAPNLAAELANADASADALEAAKFPDTHPFEVAPSALGSASAAGLNVADAVYQAITTDGKITPELAVKALRANLNMVKALVAGATGTMATLIAAPVKP